jgi:hypothetical protein
MASGYSVRGLFAPPSVNATDGSAAGGLLVCSTEELGEYPVTAVHSLRECARIAPEHPLVSERSGVTGGWSVMDVRSRPLIRSGKRQRVPAWRQVLTALEKATPGDSADLRV